MKPNFVTVLVRSTIVCAALTLGIAGRAEAQRPVPVNIESIPAGATVYLDTTTGAPLGTTPLSSVRIARGSHTLIFQLENYEEARLTITVSRRRETFRAVLRALGTIEVSAGNDSARGATVYVDGAPVGGGTLGSMPIRVPSLPPGRHQVRVERAGYVTFEEWVTVEGGQTVRLTAMLEAVAPEMGSILIDVDVRGAPIYVDGVDSGRTTNTVLDNISVGTHEIEIRAPDMEPFRQTVLVRRGERVEIHATLRPAVTAPVVGRLTVVITPAAAATVATVLIDGEPMAAGTRSRTDMEPGSHVVQVTAPGYEEATQTVTVVAGEAATAAITMVAVRGEPTDINLQASVPGASIVVDGEAHPAPYVADETEGGTHSVVVRADGHEEVSFTCSTVPGAGDDADCQRTVTLEPLRVRVHVAIDGAAPDEPATLYIDDAEMGPVPYEGRVDVGIHTFEVRAEGYGTYRQQIDVEYDEGDISIAARLTDNSEAATASATTHSALPTPAGHPTIDLSIGLPYLAEARLGIGLHEWFDAGFAIRTFGRLTEFEGRVRFGVRVIEQIALGVETRFGGGIGPSVGLTDANYAPVGMPPTTPGFARHQDLHPSALTGGVTYAPYPVNTAFFTLQGNLSLLLEPIAAVTLWAALDIHSDEYAGHPRHAGVFLDYGPSYAPPIEDRICTANAMTMTLSCRRQDMARFRIGGAVEIAVDRVWGFWAIFEGIAAQPADSRRVLGGFLADLSDIRIYPRLGVTFKF